MTPIVGLVAAELKILLGPTRLQHRDRNSLVQIGNGATFASNGPRRILRPASNPINRTKCEKTDQADDADCHDLVGETNGQTAHEGFLAIYSSSGPDQSSKMHVRRANAYSARIINTGPRSH